MGTPTKFSMLVKSPKYSIFDFSSDSKFTMPLGRIVPANQGYELMPGEEIDINLQQLTRFLPTCAPVMQRYILDFIPCFVPYRLLWNENYPIWNAEKFFNPATLDANRPAVPMTSWIQLFKNTSNKVIGSLFDYLGYPTLTGLYESLLNSTVDTSSTSVSTLGVTIGEALSNYSFCTQTNYFAFSYNGTAYARGYVRMPGFANWLMDKFAPNSDPADFTSIEDYFKSIGLSGTLTSYQDKWINEAFVLAAQTIYSTSYTKDLSLLPWLCYWKAVSDWFVRTDLVDPDSLMSSIQTACSSYLTLAGNSVNLSQINSGSGVPDVTAKSYFCSGLCAPRMWMDDYFTTSFSSAQNGSAVSIPVNGTIPQLWVANRLQEFRNRVLLSGKRFIDQIRSLWGVTVPDSRLQRTEILGHLKFNMVVSDVLQTSQSEIDSSLGNFAGQLTSSNGSHLLHYKADEPGYLMILCSVRPTTAYVDQVPRLILRKDFYDFENPMFDNVGTQSIASNELFYRPGDTSIFGYTPRRYQEYMVNFNKVSGEFKTSLDYWHAARKFNSLPGLNNNFIIMRDNDNLNRIFASTEGDNVLCQVYFDCKVTRPLSRYINPHM